MATDKAARARAAACRLDILNADPGQIRGGTGAHYGGGWMLTNSHVVGADAGNLKRIRLTFSTVVSGRSTTTLAHVRGEGPLPSRQRRRSSLQIQS